MKKNTMIYLTLLIIAAMLPLLTSSQSVFFTANMILIYVILGVSINLLTGLTGQFSFGHAGLFAVGAYVSAIATTKFEIPFFAAFLISMVAGGFVGFLLAFPCMRVKGSYLALMTWTFAEIVKLILINWTPVTGGVNGIRGIPAASIGPLVFDSEETFYLLSLVIAILASISYVRIKDSRIGIAFLAIKQDPLTAGVLGINVPRYKLLSFILCAVIAASSGSLFAHFLRNVSPDSFTLAVSGLSIQVVLLGGFGFAFSPWIGSVLIFGIGELLRVFGEFREIIIGIVVLLVLLFSPDGIIGLSDRLLIKFKNRIGTARGGSK